MKGGKRHSNKALPHLPVSSEMLITEITIKNAEPYCVQQQTSEDGIQALNLVTVSDVASESTPARDTGPRLHSHKTEKQPTSSVRKFQIPTQ